MTSIASKVNKQVYKLIIYNFIQSIYSILLTLLAYKASLSINKNGNSYFLIYF